MRFNDLKDVVNVMGDEDAGMPGVARIANEAQDPLGLFHAEIVRWLIENNQFTFEMHRSRNRNRLALAAG